THVVGYARMATGKDYQFDIPLEYDMWTPSLDHLINKIANRLFDHLEIEAWGRNDEALMITHLTRPGKILDLIKYGERHLSLSPYQEIHLSLSPYQEIHLSLSPYQEIQKSFFQKYKNAIILRLTGKLTEENPGVEFTKINFINDDIAG